MRNNSLNVLFLCTGNSARSIMAECILNRLGKGRFQAFSAGSHPKGEIHPHALALLRSCDYEVSGLRSKSWDEFARHGAPRIDLVITVCGNAAKETCPIWPRQPRSACWDIPDPAAVTGSDEHVAEAFAEAYRLLSTRITALCDA